MGISLSHLLLTLLIILIVFGAGKLPKVMGDIGKGIKNLKEGLHAEDSDEEIENKKISNSKKKKKD